MVNVRDELSDDVESIKDASALRLARRWVETFFCFAVLFRLGVHSLYHHARATDPGDWRPDDDDLRYGITASSPVGYDGPDPHVHDMRPRYATCAVIVIFAAVFRATPTGPPALQALLIANAAFLFIDPFLGFAYYAYRGYE